MSKSKSKKWPKEEVAEVVEVEAIDHTEPEGQVVLDTELITTLPQEVHSQDETTELISIPQLEGQGVEFYEFQVAVQEIIQKHF